MYCVKNVTEDLYWVGGTDRRLELFENVYPIPEGVSYNSYLLLDEKTVLLDTVDQSVSEIFFENIAHVLAGRTLDLLIINHMEPDHAATIARVAEKYPEVQIVCNAKTATMMKQYFDFDVDAKALIVKEGDTVTSGKHTFTFVNAPMVHWPEVMFTYDTTEGILFSADAFGTFGAMNGNLFADEVNFETEWADSARRYFTNIVGKYGMQVMNVLKKASTIDIRMICPLHGPIWRENLGWFIDKYSKWASYTPEEASVLIVYGSVYGHTENAANILASELADRGIRNIAVYDVSKTDASYLVAEAFKRSHIVFASATYNNEIFTKMEQYLLELKEHNFKNRTVAIIENGTWAPQAGKKIREFVDGMKDMTVLGDTVTVKSAVKDSEREQLIALAEQIAASVKAAQ
ncbi:MAG: FprA family A-type flavoprotein [Eubacterium sp.]|nr:FprA family A-type flavoprotein [Eubacterium sp.]